MGKQGPCRHCSVTTTPLWRNGPPEKPVLCNACGSRWRTKGSLTNYTPLHARELIESEEAKLSNVKSLPFKPSFKPSFKLKEKKLQKIKRSGGSAEDVWEIPHSDQNYRKNVEGNASNRSSSASATSYSESCAHIGTTEASEVTGSAQSNVWEPQVPSKKRTCIITRAKPTPMEKFAEELHTMMQGQESSNLSSTEGDLLYDSSTPFGSFEIGNGSYLLKYPNPRAIEEESETSSLPKDNKLFINTEACSGSAIGIEKFKRSTTYQEHVKRDKSHSEKLHILDRTSALGLGDLKDVKLKENVRGKEAATGSNFLGCVKHTSLETARDTQNMHFPGSQSVFYAEDLDDDAACFSSRTIFAGSSSDHDLLLHVPCNTSSFPDAELLRPSHQKQVSRDDSAVVSGVLADGEESRSGFQASNFSIQKPRQR